MFDKLSRKALALAVGTTLTIGSAHAFVVNDTFSGNWSEAVNVNQPVYRGVILDVIEGQGGDFAPTVLVQWFTYLNGEKFWLLGDGIVDPNTNSMEFTLNQYLGGEFDPAPNANVEPSDWGTATLTFKSCSSATMQYQSEDQSLNGEVSLRGFTNENCVIEKPFDSCPDFASAGPETLPGSCVIEGAITEDVRLTNETLWLLNGQVRVEDGASVTIEPNTEIVGGAIDDGGDFDVFVVAQGGKIFAEGTVENPIVMRGFDPLQQFPTTESKRGQWGGLVVNGFAPINACNNDGQLCTAEGEGNTGTYGGLDPNDNSGVMRYLIVSNAGFQFNSDDELNGIALQGVGDGTTFEFIQVHLNADDGIEFFGGTVNARNIVLTGIGDDSIDWTEGWQGDIQYAVVRQYNDDGDQGIEGDNNGDANDAEPRSLPRIANATFIGSENADIGWLIREGTGVSISNSIVTGFGDECVDFDQQSTFENAENLTFANNIIGLCGDGPFADNETEEADGDRPEFTDTFLVSAFILDQPGNIQTDPGLFTYKPLDNSPALNVGPVIYQDGFFDNVSFAGALPSFDVDWTAGWTVGLGPLRVAP